MAQPSLNSGKQSTRFASCGRLAAVVLSAAFLSGGLAAWADDANKASHKEPTKVVVADPKTQEAVNQATAVIEKSLAFLKTQQDKTTHTWGKSETAPGFTG